MDGVVMVQGCLRDGRGGSPTAVVIMGGAALSDLDLMTIPARTGASHVAAISTGPGQNPGVRFFTATGELPSCGHGTVAAITALALAGTADRLPGQLRVAGRATTVSGVIESRADGGATVTAWFDQGIISRRDTTEEELHAFLAALRLDRTDLHADHSVAVASPGRERILLPIADAGVLAGLRPDMQALAAVSQRLGQLGCLAYVPPSRSRRATARMFAPAIGVPEDIANANSSGCLAAVLLMDGHDPTIAVDQGDALGSPSTVYATADTTGPGVITARVGGVGRLHSD
jgi:trans-2,3-dihydro-3-hydroxyanthranilate isomerase